LPETELMSSGACLTDRSLKLYANPVGLDKTCAEFFAGIGLMRYGLERCGWRVVFANDIDPQKQEMYAAQYPESDPHFVIRDVHDLQTYEVPSVTLATASFPCNDLSLAGARKGLLGKQSSALWGFTRVLEEMSYRRPPIVMLENVPGFLTSHNGTDFANALAELNRLGYSVDAFMVDAIRFVPQSRQRLFVIGSQLYEPSVKQRTLTLGFFESEARPKPLADFIFNHTEIDWAIRDLPPLPASTGRLEDIIDTESNSQEPWWPSDRAEYLLNQMSAKHRQIANTRIAAEKVTYGTVFRRVRNGTSMAELRTDGIAGCLRTPRGGSGRQILFKAGFGEYHVRLLSARECARLMGADDFRISAPRNQALFGFGDAVCASVIEWIGTHYLNPLVVDLAESKERNGRDGKH